MAKGLISQDRVALGKYIQWFTGHGWLRAAQAKRGEKESGKCRHCNNGEETPQHLWSTCQAQDTTQTRVRCGILNNLWSLGEVDRFLGTKLMVNLLQDNEEE